MNKYEAMVIFNISSMPNEKDLKLMYRKLCSKYHPDKNQNGQEKMKDINVAYDTLLKNKSILVNKTFYDNPFTYPNEDLKNKVDKVFKEVQKLKSKGIGSIKDGMKIWVNGNTYECRDELKKLKFRWIAEKKMWCFNATGIY